jgi:hypothetical protein
MDKRVALTVRDMADGSYELCGTVEVSGEYELSVELGGESVIGSGRTVTVGHGEVDAAHCRVVHPTEGVAGEVQRAIVFLHDRFGNGVTSGSPMRGIECELVGPVTVPFVACKAVDGQVELHTVLKVAGVYAVHVRSCGAPILPSTTLTILPGQVCMKTSKSRGLRADPVKAMTTMSIAIDACDMYGNAITVLNQPLEATLTGPQVCPASL